MKSLMSILSVLFFLNHTSGYSNRLAIIGNTIPTEVVSRHKLSTNISSLLKHLFVRDMLDFEATKKRGDSTRIFFSQILGNLFVSKLGGIFAVGLYSVQSEAGVKLHDCGGVLTDNKYDPLMAQFGFNASRIYLAPIGFSTRIRVTAYAPADGIGRLLAAQNLMPFEGSLQKAAKIFPRYFERYDIKAQGSILVIPDSMRINGYLKNGLQFEDIPFFKSQLYPESYFLERLRKKRKVPIASTLDAMYHDRFEEHLLGGIIMPKHLVKQLFAYAEFEIALKSHRSYLDNRRIRPIVERYSTSRKYDWATTELGRAIDLLSESIGDKSLNPQDQIQILTDAILESSMALDPNRAIDNIQRWRNDISHKNDENFKTAAESLKNLKKDYPSNSLTMEQARSEAEVIIAELKKLPLNL